MAGGDGQNGVCSDPASNLVVIGASHRTASVAVRERLQVEPEALAETLARLRTAGIGSAALLATCDRVEVIAAVDGADAASARIGAWLAARAGCPPAELSPHLYDHRGEAAVAHLFAVTAALDSLVIGEPHVLGQVKASHRAAREAGMVNAVLEAAFQAAYAAAKRVRTETAIAEQPVSMAAAAVQVARDLHGEPQRCAALFVGHSEMSALIHDALAAAGMVQFAVTHPSPRRAERQACDWSCLAPPFAALDAALAAADVVVSAVGGRQPLLTRALLKQALRARRQRPMFVIDAAVPGDVDRAADSLDGVFRYDLHDLEAVATAGRAHREREAGAARQIVDAAVAAWQRDRSERRAVPVLASLHRHVEAVRQAALADAGGDAEQATRLFARRLLHGPSAALRDAAATGADDLAALSRALDRAFGLNGTDAGPPERAAAGDPPPPRDAEQPGAADADEAARNAAAAEKAARSAAGKEG